MGLAASFISRFMLYQTGSTGLMDFLVFCSKPASHSFRHNSITYSQIQLNDFVDLADLGNTNSHK